MLKLKVTTRMNEGGRRISKQATVVTNDPENRKLQLRIFGDVKAYVSVEPPRVMFSGTVGESIKRHVRIIPRTEEGFKIKRVRALRGTDISYRLEDTEKDGKRTYILQMENTREIPGRYYDKIFITTDSDVVGEISLIVSGHIRPKIESSG